MVIGRITLLLALVTAIGQASNAAPDVAELESVGRALFAKDRAAWLATDRLAEANGGIPGDLRGWVVVPSSESWRVVFVQEEGDVFCSMLSVVVDDEGAGALQRSDACEPLTADQRSMFLARQTALSALNSGCSENYNTVVLPYDGTEAAWAVYLLAATTDASEAVIGGHVRVLVGDGGMEIVDYQPLSKGC